MNRALWDLRRPVVIAAFEGWNDAADAASDLIDHLATSYPTELAWTLDSEDFYDFQVARPRVCLGEHGREVEWPTTSVRVAHLPTRDLVLVSGPEPNLRWRSFATTLISCFLSISPELVVLLGAMLTDSVHNRPLPVTGSCSDRVLGARLGLEPSSYEGPTGIVGVLNDSCRRAGQFPVVSLWASVPHYVSNPSNPKATLALLGQLERVLDTPIERRDLPELAQQWERNVDELAADDPDVADYIALLAEQQDEDEVPEQAGEAIAEEFERYLRRRNQRD